jgi:hypothetical protein
LAPSASPPTSVPVPTTTDAAPGETIAQPQAPKATAEQTAIISDLHWLVHQGHVIEFANGLLETAKKPLPKPPKAEPKQSAAPATELIPSEDGVSTPAGETETDSSTSSTASPADSAESPHPAEQGDRASSSGEIHDEAPTEKPAEPPATPVESPS